VSKKPQTVTIKLTPQEQRALLAAIHGAIDDAGGSYPELSRVEKKIREARKT